MSKKITHAVALWAGALLAGCAAQSYARLEPVTEAEAVVLSCELIDAEVTRAEGFLHEVRGQKPWWTPTTLTNAGERRAAARSAQERLGQLRAARETLDCPSPYGA